MRRAAARIPTPTLPIRCLKRKKRKQPERGALPCEARLSDIRLAASCIVLQTVNCPSDSDRMLCIVILPAAVKAANILSRKPAGFPITFRKKNITPGKARNITLIQPRTVFGSCKKKKVQFLHCLLPYEVSPGETGLPFRKVHLSGHFLFTTKPCRCAGTGTGCSRAGP